MARGPLAGAKATKTRQRAQGGHDKSEESPVPQSNGIRVANQQALQAGIPLAREELRRAAPDDSYRVVTAKSQVHEMDIGRMSPQGNRIGNLISSDRQSLQQIAEGFNDIRGEDPLLEAEKERQLRLAEIASPYRGLFEGIRMQTSVWEQVAEASNASLHRLAEALAPRLPTIEIGLGHDAIRELAAIGDFGCPGNLRDPVRVHAIPRPAFPVAHRQARRPDELPNREQGTSHQEPQERVLSELNDELQGKDSHKLLEQLIRFRRSDEISSDAREGMSVLITWWKLNQRRITADQSVELNRRVQSLIRTMHGLTTAPDSHQQLSSGLLVPRSNNGPPPPDLAPEVYTTEQLAKQLYVSPDTLKRHARGAYKKGPLPQSLPDFPDWFVVVRSDPRGGQNRGWKFQFRRNPGGV